MPVFPAIFERVAGSLLSVDGSATQLPAILLAILIGVDAPLDQSGPEQQDEHNTPPGDRFSNNENVIIAILISL